MDFVLVFPLILAFLSTGQSYTEVTEQTSNSCFEKCPAGYHKIGSCGNLTGQYRCQKCGNNEYTEIPNLITKCQRCDLCSHIEKEIKSCSFNSNVVCDCKDGYYNANSKSKIRDCRACSSARCGVSDVNEDYKRKCNPCQRKECLAYPECERKSTAITIPPSTTTTTSSATSPRTTASNPTLNLNEMTWLLVVAVMGTGVVLLWLLLIRNQLRYPYSFPCWSVNKDLELSVEDPKFNEQRSHQVSTPTTLTFKVSEETPMMNLSSTTPEHAAPCSPVLPDTEHKADRRDEQLEHWPAIVLYTIIKEVPLRRWKEFLRLLSVADQQLERVELEAGLGLGSMERQYQMLRLWSQRSSASLNDVFSALHYMDLSGCAQLLQESLEKLQCGGLN
ncbi:tumor necrosis factor receptor superfamily member 1A [Micropterus salmoides]|uniref:tumor necrosis factor receptor superfamily member 1A n=1 Tax=Micropterus salmoides TaxID=27706 RepID=UPI0018ED74AE|nr:tumor necrosis factor receptor superfamily member 1A [Micropterus salmoides]